MGRPLSQTSGRSSGHGSAADEVGPVAPGARNHDASERPGWVLQPRSTTHAARDGGALQVGAPSAARSQGRSYGPARPGPGRVGPAPGSRPPDVTRLKKSYPLVCRRSRGVKVGPGGPDRARIHATSTFSTSKDGPIELWVKVDHLSRLGRTSSTSWCAAGRTWTRGAGWAGPGRVGPARVQSRTPTTRRNRARGNSLGGVPSVTRRGSWSGPGRAGPGLRHMNADWRLLARPLRNYSRRLVVLLA